MATGDPATAGPAHPVRPPLGSTNQTAAPHTDGGRTKAGRWLVTHTHDINMDTMLPHEY